MSSCCASSSTIAVQLDLLNGVAVAAEIERFPRRSLIAVQPAARNPAAVDVLALFHRSQPHTLRGVRGRLEVHFHAPADDQVVVRTQLDKEASYLVHGACDGGIRVLAARREAGLDGVIAQ